MQRELQMVKEILAKNGVTIREEPPKQTRDLLPELMSRRKMLRVEIDLFLQALGGNDLVTFSAMLGNMAFAVAGALAQFGMKLDFPDYVTAITDMVQEAQHEVDRAIQFQDWAGAQTSIAKLQLIWMGCAANLGMPYGALMHYLHECYMKGESADRAEITKILRAAGMQVNDSTPAANDEAKP